MKKFCALLEEYAKYVIDFEKKKIFLLIKKN